MMRLPKPAETNVTHDRRHIGSVYTAEQMRKYAAKATAKEREACAKVCEQMDSISDYYGERVELICAEAIRARGEKA